MTPFPDESDYGGFNSGAPWELVLVLLVICAVGALGGWLWYRSVERRRVVTRYVFDERDRLTSTIPPRRRVRRRK